MVSERILHLFAKKIGKAASDKELTELQELLRQNTDDQGLLELLHSIERRELHRKPTSSESDLVAENWLRLQEELVRTPTDLSGKGRARSGGSFPQWMRLVAVWTGLLLLLGGGYFVFRHSEKNSLAAIDSKVSLINRLNGIPLKKMLPDSSIVWLNAGSIIRYDSNFIQKSREVYLEGEAYFSVKHDPSHPFIVHAGNITVHALGTTFNVQAYRNENKIEATLISGKVLVKIDGKPDQDIILEPKEKITVTNEERRFANNKVVLPKELSYEVKGVTEIPSIEAVAEVAWLQDKLAFQNEAFDELAKKMERRFNIHIIFKDSLLGKERLSGVFENESIQKALDLLQMTTTFHYRITGDTAYLSN